MVNKIYIYIAFFIVCNLGFSQSTDQNYIKETIYANENNVSNPSSSKNIVTTTYLDGLGRTIQVIEQNASPESGKSIITHVEYEKNIGKIKNYLPFTNSGTQFVADAKTNTINFHSNLYAYEYMGTNNPYSEVRLEKRPDPRVLETAAPGKDWAMGNGHTIKTEYNFNVANEVKKYNISTTWDATTESFKNSISDNGFYPKSALHKTIVKNENWTSGKNNTIEEFKGVDGKVILKRTYNNNVAHDTYYAYDFHGNLAFVIPPLANGVVTETNLNTLCYRYIYDKKNRLIEKKLPQKDWEYIVYDKADRIVLTGPVYSPFGNSTKGWIFSKYDDLSRVVYTGFYNASTFSSAERKNIQTTVNNQTVVNETKQTSNITLDGIAIRYSNNAFPTTSTHLLSINYYDDYLYPNAPTAFPSIESVATIQKPKGLQTGSWIRTVTTDAERKGDLSYTLYNAKYQPLRSYTINSFGGYIQTDNVMLFNGTPTKSITKYKKTSSDGETVITNSFTYDNQNRLLTQKQQIGSQPQETILSNVYDQLGVLVTKNVGATSGNLQKVDYKYNVRGWLTTINNYQFDPLDEKDLFSLIINYNNDGYHILDDEILYNGGISSILWQTKNDNKLRGYTFDYDHLNRLTNAQTLRSLGGGPGMSRKTEHQESLTYDKNGNILSLYRTGEEPDGQLNEIDELTYSYTGNRLMKVTDENGSPDGFKDGTNTGDDYEYDDFGNITKDNNKNISNIKYNHLNLPTEITFNTGKILYTYDASGSKVKKVVQPTSGLAQTTEYINGFQYLNGKLQFFPHAEGYVKPKDGGGYLYVYQYKDHLGNVRLSYADLNGDGEINPAEEILEEKNYYPFGLQHDGYNMGVRDERSVEAEQIKYNGKEFEDSFGLNMYEMDLRQYDPAIGRWIVQDPVVHHDFSPYSAFDNNPVYWADPSGADAVPILDGDKTIGWSFSGDDLDDFYNYYNQYTNNNFEATYQNFYEFVSLNESEGGGGQVGLSSESFNFQTLTSNWQAAGVTGLVLSVTDRRGKIKEVKFEIEVGLPIKLKDGTIISSNLAKKASTIAANQAAIDIGSMAQLSNGKFYSAPSLVQKAFATSMQAHLNSEIKNLLDLSNDIKIGSRVNSPIQSNISTQPAVWNKITIINQIILILDRFF
ncbi:DUF6443 domain-containing protein [Flavobacterium sp. I3-2]|uniref:DUF6443 domain-containing protein n=1 Tax=Flavobacterium sp. I3-2 TaxID=2748319 RepID=UPI0015AAAD0C|nr:DUF6443 domain-containing protein [Flavobacterium sp. I3-2]